MLPQAWNRFVEEDEGRNKGNLERLRQLISERVKEGFVAVQTHPNCADLAIVVVRQPDGGTEVHGLPMSDSYRSVMKFFDADSRGEPVGFAVIRKVHYTAQFRPETVDGRSGPELVGKGRVLL
jgi:hypothetical protein